MTSIYDTLANRSAMPNADRSLRLLPQGVAEVVLFLTSAGGSIATGNLTALEK